MTDLRARSFDMLDTSDVPSVPGIYAWYTNFRSGEQDWAFRAGPSGDEAIPGFLELVSRYAQQFESLPLRLTGRGAYGATWSGDLEIEFPFRRKQSDEGGTTETGRISSLMPGVESEAARKVFAAVLHRVTPTFSAPLYIGVTDDLSRRLKDHRKDYTRTYEWLKKHPEDTEKIRQRGDSFGARAAARSIAMENLEVWIIDLAEEMKGVPTSELRSIAEAAEWFLHRIYSPLLGRR